MVEHYPKLVRDRIPEIIQQEGKRAYIHIASSAELEGALVKKLQEEVDEFKRSRDPHELGFSAGNYFGKGGVSATSFNNHHLT